MIVHVQLLSTYKEGFMNWNWQRAKRAQRSIAYLELKRLVTKDLEKDMVITFGKKTVYLYNESRLFPSLYATK